ncbi:MAG: thiamine biosynthesis lipoprotein [Oleispira sp.]|jgi:thiamine biosynthesis lipoprotein
MATVSNLNGNIADSGFHVIPFASGWKCYFRAMASPCEILIGACPESEAQRLSLLAWTEVKRIEQKFSRYRDDNIIFEINTSQGKAIEIDEETYRLLTFSDQCFQASEGLFDITSGVLRKVWAFHSNAVIPSQAEIEELLPLVGWQNVKWDANSIQLKPMMELDFGGIGKEYAADRVLLLLTESHRQPYLVNLGGDIATNGALFPEHEWRVGIEAISDKLVDNVLKVQEGAIATSGDSRRYLLSNGIRYSHILNPQTGWPIKNAPHSMTIMAPSCVQAGMLSSLALLQGQNAESFLDEMGIQYWSQR